MLIKFSKMFAIFGILLIHTVFYSINGQNYTNNDWTYADQNEWNLHFEACGGTHESPINIDLTKVKINSKLRIDFYNYNEKYSKSTVQNNGHTVRVFLLPNADEKIPYVYGEAINNETFILDSFHFHWGLNQFNGSEHSINGVKRSAELHLVHWNQKYGNMTNARDREDGLVVVTVFIESKIVKPYGVVEVIAHNRALIPIIEVLPQIKEYSKSVPMRVPLNMKALIPLKKDLFYKYAGSLTTPPCSQSATFIIFSDPIYMTANQLHRFRDINGEPIDGKSHHLTHNTRDQMPINDRVVEVSNPFAKTNTKIE